MDRKLKQIVALKKVLFVRCRFSMHFTTQLMPNAPFVKSCSYKSLMVVLCYYSGHENIIRLLNIIKAENNKDLYLVFDYMETGILDLM